MKHQVFIAAMATLLLGFPALGSAQAPGLMSFHGYLTDLSGNPVDEPELGATFQVNIYHESDSTQAFWTDEFVDVPVSGGVFRLLLGSGNNPLPSNALDGGVKYVGIGVNSGPEMEPKLQLVSVPYAFRADTANTANIASSADALAGIPAANYAQISAVDAVQGEVAALQATIESLQGKVDVLQALVNGAGCANECVPGSQGCSDDLSQIWTCGEANDDDPCTEQLYETCTGLEKCHLGECTCAPNFATVCSGNSAYNQDSCGQLGTLIGVCGEGLCNLGTCLDWELETPPALAGMNDTYAIGGELYSVGANGQIVHYDGNTWARMPSGTTKDLQAIWGYESNGTRLYAVGEGGKVLFYDGSQWSTVLTGVFQNLHDVFGLSATDIYAVGDNGTLLRYNGTAWIAEQWEPAEHPWQNATFRAVWAHSASQVWLAGVNGIIVQWDGTEWTQQAAPGGVGDIQALWGISANNVWAATSSTIIRYTNSWGVEQINPTGVVNLRAIWGEVDGPNFRFFAGGTGGAAYSYDSVSWAKQNQVDEELTNAADIVGVVGGTGDAPFDSVWVVADNGEVAYNDPTGKWVFPSIQHTVTGFYTANTGDGQWAVGSNCSAYKQNNGQWLPVDVEGCTGDLNAVWGDGTDELIIAVGGQGAAQTYLTWDGVEWVDMAPDLKPNAGEIHDIWGIDNFNLLTVHDTGTFVWNGTNWQHTGGGGGTAGWGDSMTNFYVCNFSGVSHFDGSEWTYTDLGAGGLTDIHGSGDSVWTVGDAGQVYELVGGVWQSREIGTTLPIRGVFVNGNTVHVAGDNGFTASGNGDTWDTQVLFPPSSLATVSGAAGGKILTGGTGVIFRR